MVLAADGFGTVFEIAKTAHGYASTPTTLVSFNGTNGSIPEGSLIADAHGDLFGTTDGGTVFEIAKTSHGYATTPTTLVSFNGTDGSGPTGSLIADAHGDLFGTTALGGALFGTTAFGGAGVGTGDGTVFEIAKTAHGYATTPTTLVSFNGPNGAEPLSGLIADTHGDLFGTTLEGGAFGATFPGANVAPDSGTVFEITGSGFSTHKTPSCSVAESHDSFVFDPKLGENTSVHSNMHDEAFDHPKSESADFAALLTQAQGDGAHQTAHDATDVTDHAATLAAQHAHHFLV